MNIEKIRSRKALKFLGLLVSAMVIAGVSAQVYSYMFITGTAEVTTTGLRWVEGLDAPNSTTISGSTVSNLNLTTNEGNPRNYTDCLRIQNLDPGEDHNFFLNVTTSTGNTSNWQAFNLMLFNATTGGTKQAELDLLIQGESVGGLTIPGGETWGVLFELVPISNPATGQQIAFAVKLTYESAV
jgi:hypothetical protein